MSAVAPPLLAAHQLGKRFGRGQRSRQAVDEVSFAVQRGDIYGLLGPNGAGKSTLLRMLMGLIRPTSGSVAFAGAAMTARTRRHIGAAIEYPSFYGYLSARDNLRMLGAVSGAELAPADLERALARVGLTALIATFLWVFLTTLFLVVLAYLIGLVALGGGDMVVFVWQFREQGIWFIAGPDWMYCLLACVAIASLSMMVLVSFTLFLSALVDNPLVALAAALGVFFMSSVIQQMPAELIGEGLRQWLPTTHMNAWHEMYRAFRPGGGADLQRIWTDVAWCGGYIAVFTGAMYAVFARRDVVA